MYPYTSLSSALKIAEAVKLLAGVRSQVQISSLASHLQDGEKSAAFRQRIAGSKAFALITGRGSFSLTPTAQRYYFPTSESERASAVLDILTAPIAFRELVKRFDGSRLPERSIIANLLHRELRVPESWKDRVAAFFENAARLAGVIDESGFLRYRASQHDRSSSTDTQANGRFSSVQDEPSSQTQTEIVEAVGQPLGSCGKAPHSNVWSFSYQGMGVRLETPADISNSLWEKLNAYVQLLKPIQENETK